MWASGTQHYNEKYAIMQDDGNFVLYGLNGHPIFATGTQGNPGSYLIVQNDGNVVIYNQDDVAVWSTGTWNYCNHNSC
jgi:hypothetical protein